MKLNMGQVRAAGSIGIIVSSVISCAEGIMYLVDRKDRKEKEAEREQKAQERHEKAVLADTLKADYYAQLNAKLLAEKEES